MSVSGVSAATVVTAAPAVGATVATPTATIGGGGGAEGAFGGGSVAQTGGIGSVIKKMVVGAVAGGALGSGAGAIAGAVAGFGIGALPGWAAGGLIGAGVGAVIGLVKGVMDMRKGGTLGMQAPSTPNAVQPQVVQAPRKGRTIKAGGTGTEIKGTQRALKALGLYSGKLTGKLDPATAKAIRRYELLKGAMPTGISTPELRWALTQDVRVSHQFS